MLRFSDCEAYNTAKFSHKSWETTTWRYLPRNASKPPLTAAGRVQLRVCYVQAEGVMVRGPAFWQSGNSVTHLNIVRVQLAASDAFY